MRPFVFLFLIAIAGAFDARAENVAPYSGTQRVDTGKPFERFVGDLKSAITANKMGIVAEACADCGANSLGLTLRGNRVIMIFHPRFAVRMLEASVAAGIEAPLRLYVIESDDGTARLTFRLPSHVFGAYEVPELDVMAVELDAVVKTIVEQAVAK